MRAFTFFSGLFAVNGYYSRFFLKEQRLNLFAGGGLGRVTVPPGTDPEARGMLFGIEAGIHIIFGL